MNVDHKRLVNFTNDGPCIGLAGKKCGPGTQKQVGVCVDGIKQKCTGAYPQRYTPVRTVACEEACSALEPCPGKCIYFSNISTMAHLKILFFGADVRLVELLLILIYL